MQHPLIKFNRMALLCFDHLFNLLSCVTRALAMIGTSKGEGEKKEERRKKVAECRAGAFRQDFTYGSNTPVTCHATFACI